MTTRRSLVRGALEWYRDSPLSGVIPTYPFTHYYWRFRNHARHYRQLLQYPDSIARPYELIQVPLQDVNYMMTRQFSYRKQTQVDFTHIIGGNWDEVMPDAELHYINSVERRIDRRGIMPLQNCSFHRAVTAHVRDGIPWEETEFFQWVCNTEEFHLNRVWEYNDEAGRKWRFDQLDRLAASMSEEGYKTQRECNPADSSGHDKFDPLLRPRGAPPECHEVALNVGRDGTFVLDEGRHRFTVARAIGLDSIPVRIFVRHEQWQEKRAEVARATHPSDLRPDIRGHLTHPDMKDVVTFNLQEG